jgi:hypothetical protein
LNYCSIDPTEIDIAGARQLRPGNIDQKKTENWFGGRV